MTDHVRVAYCWHDECGAELQWINHRWVCPEGHRLRRYEDLNPWVRDHIEYMQTDPAMHRRYFGDPP